MLPSTYRYLLTPVPTWQVSIPDGTVGYGRVNMNSNPVRLLIILSLFCSIPDTRNVIQNLRFDGKINILYIISSVADLSDPLVRGTDPAPDPFVCHPKQQQ